MYPAHTNHIRLLPLHGGPPRDLVVTGWSNFNSGPDWAADGKGFYISSQSPSGATLVYVDLEGHATAVRGRTGCYDTYGIQSPDGQRLLMRDCSADSNVWMLENF